MSTAVPSVHVKRSEFWITTAITSGIVALLSTATIAAWAWWINQVDGAFGYCERGDDSNVTHGNLVWDLVPPGPRCVFTEQANGFDATSPVYWAWTILVGIAVLSTVIACCAVAGHLWASRHVALATRS
jgi:hypothetical protein